MLKTLKRIYNAISYVVIAAVIILVILLWGVKLFGYSPYTVLSGSMEPKYHVGSVIYVTDVTPGELKVGDPLTFTLGGNVITHEIIEIKGGGSAFVTQGLTNNISDGEIPASNIIGRPVFSIPYLGYVSSYLQNQGGMISVMCILVIFFLISFVFDFIPDKTKDAQASKQENILSDTPSDPDGSTEDNINNKKL